ncbi:MAG: LemA family protein [Chitinophagaceae bacterium]|nr:LemA family protein [Chitinophagaceae bacterium]
MKKGILVLLGVVALLVIWAVSSYNGLVGKEEEVKKWWSKVQTQYQRRADVFKNAVETVKGAAANEKEILLGVTKARAGIDESQEKMKTAQTPAELDAALRQAQTAAMNLKIQIEAYPNIRSTDAFTKFQDEVSGTENRIAVARNDYNDAVQTFNTSIRRFPTNIFANIMGLKVRESFEAEKGSEKSPDVKF